jgi:hypothetical protein
MHPPPQKKKFTNPIISEAGIVEFSNAVDNSTRGVWCSRSRDSRDAFSLYIDSFLYEHLAFDFWIPRLFFSTTYD